MNDCHRGYTLADFTFDSPPMLHASLKMKESVSCIIDQVGALFTGGVHLDSSSEQLPVKMNMLTCEELAMLEITLSM